MLLFGVDLPLWVVLTVVLALLLYWLGTNTHGTFKKLGVPHQNPLPFLGNMREVFTKSMPEVDMELAQQFPGKVYGKFLGKRPVLCVGDVEFLKEITIKQTYKFRNHSGLLDGEDNIHTRHVGTLKDEHWKHVRSILTPTFTSGKLKRMFPVIKGCADKLISHLKSTKSEPIAIKDYTAGYTMDVIASTGFGMDIDSQSTTNHPFVTHASRIMNVQKNLSIKDIVKGIVLMLSVFVFPKFLRIFLSEYCGLSFADEESVAYFTEVIDKFTEHQQQSETQANNFLSMCYPKVVDVDKIDTSEVHKSSGFTWTTAGLTRKDFIANAIIFLSAGYETTATSLQFFLYSMALHPHIQEKLHSEIEKLSDDFTYDELQKLEYLDWCVCESLRMYPPAARIDRICCEETTIKDIVIPEGLVISGQVYAIHHDPDYWPNPETFDPSRFSPENKTEAQQYAYLPFGAGGRNCIASRLALLEMKVALVKVIRAFTFEKTSETPAQGSGFKKKSAGLLDAITPIKISAVPR